jgi:hypothetical protein
MATDASSGSDRRSGRVCRATLATALCGRATDAPVLLQQTQCVSVHRGDVGARRRSSAATDAAPRVGAYWTASVVATERDLPSVGRVCCAGIDRWFLKLVDTWHMVVRRTLDAASVVHEICPTALCEGVRL